MEEKGLRITEEGRVVIEYWWGPETYQLEGYCERRLDSREFQSDLGSIDHRNRSCLG